MHLIAPPAAIAQAMAPLSPKLVTPERLAKADTMFALRYALFISNTILPALSAIAIRPAEKMRVIAGSPGI
jgi:hypothetical protein